MIRFDKTIIMEKMLNIGVLPSGGHTSTIRSQVKSLLVCIQGLPYYKTNEGKLLVLIYGLKELLPYYPNRVEMAEKILQELQTNPVPIEGIVYTHENILQSIKNKIEAQLSSS
jgi:hypothetical protein